MRGAEAMHRPQGYEAFLLGETHAESRQIPCPEKTPARLPPGAIPAVSIPQMH